MEGARGTTGKVGGGGSADRILVGKVGGKFHLKDLGLDGNIILK